MVGSGMPVVCGGPDKSGPRASTEVHPLSPQHCLNAYRTESKTVDQHPWFG